jgi:DNA primase
VFYEDRLVVPVVQGRMLVGYQARVIQGESACKYLTVSVKTAASLYNRDVAMFQRDIVLVEGVTDVWRIGPSSVALFGKTVKSGQLALMKLLWGFSGSCVVCLDRDDPHAAEAQRKMVQLLRQEKVFPRGVSGAELPPGKDPADVPLPLLLEILEGARRQCK